MGRGRCLIAAVAVALVISGLATAGTAVSGRDKAAIRAAVHKAWLKAVAAEPAGCPWAGHPFGFRGSKVARSDRHYGLGLINDNDCVYTTGYILRRPNVSGEGWRVILAIPDSAQLCAYFRKDVPERVLRVFGIEGQLTGSGGFGPC